MIKEAVWSPYPGGGTGESGAIRTPRSLRPADTKATDKRAASVTTARGVGQEWEAFERRWKPMLCRYFQWLRCSRDELDELTSDALTDAFVAVHRSSEEEHVELLIHQAARAASSQHARLMRQRRHSVPVDLVALAANEQDTAMHREAVWAILDRLLSELPKHQRVILERHMDGVPDQLVGLELGYTSQSVRNQRYRAMLALRLRVGATSFPDPRPAVADGLRISAPREANGKTLMVEIGDSCSGKRHVERARQSHLEFRTATLNHESCGTSRR